MSVHLTVLILDDATVEELLDTLMKHRRDKKSPPSKPVRTQRPRPEDRDAARAALRRAGVLSAKTKR